MDCGGTLSPQVVRRDSTLCRWGFVYKNELLPYTLQETLSLSEAQSIKMPLLAQAPKPRVILGLMTFGPDVSRLETLHHNAPFS
jgi:hypothetical protein